MTTICGGGSGKFVENPDGSMIRLKDVSRIDLGTQTYAQRGRFKTAPAAIHSAMVGPLALPAAQFVAGIEVEDSHQLMNRAFAYFRNV